MISQNFFRLRSDDFKYQNDTFILFIQNKCALMLNYAYLLFSFLKIKLLVDCINQLTELSCNDNCLIF